MYVYCVESFAISSATVIVRAGVAIWLNSFATVLFWLQTTQPTSGGAVTANSNCCANCVEPPRPQQWGPDLLFLGMRTCWIAGAVAHKSG